MPGSLTLLKGLPRYEVFLEEAKCFPGLDASACYTYLQLLRTGDELLALDQKYAQLCRQSLLESSPQREAEPQQEILASEVAEPEEERLQV